MSSGHWVRYQLFYGPTPLYGNATGQWTYEYLDSFYPQPFVASAWKEKFIEYITANGTYTCILEEVPASSVPEEHKRDVIQRHQDSVKKYSALSQQYAEELLLLEKS